MSQPSLPPCEVLLKTFPFGLPAIVCVLFLLIVFPVGSGQAEEQEFSLPPMEMGETLLKMGQLEPAEAIFSRLFTTDAENPYVVRGLVKSLAGLKKIEEAEERLQDYLKEHPESSSVLYGLGLIRLMERKPDEAEEFLSKAIALSPANAPALNTLAVSLFEKKDYQKAVEQLHQAIQTSPGDLLVYRNLWRTYAAMGKESVYLEEFEQARANKSTPRILGYGRAYAGHLRQEGFKAYEQGNLDTAYLKMKTMLDVYREIGHASGEVSALFSLGLLEEERGKKQDAIQTYKSLLTISPNHIQARERLGALEEDIKNQ